ncbi:hypothetical protein HYY71_02810 [Candidatus Woesearchaeota archaeon]|nr:hypothetical protein [Candidatus Woesearchaeota archaeon]
MKESSWDECLNYSSAVKITPDKEKAASLAETAHDRIKFSLKKLSEKNANYVFEGYYSSILEMAHAIVILDGYKVNNHICLGYYLRDVLGNDDLFRLFDDCRFKRNSLVYYGKRMDFETAKDAIEKAKKLINELKNVINEKRDK